LHSNASHVDVQRASAIELRRKAIECGMITLRESGLYKLRDGLTTMEEVVKETVL
jgi:type IV pilus assembly protein PilB